MPTRGRFIVVEGIDGSGTTTQVKMLADALQARKLTVHATREPSDGPLGMLVRQILAGRIIVGDGKAPGWATMALLFAADRMDHVEAELEPYLSHGTIVVSDRYDASSLAYQSAMSGSEGEAAVEWIRILNRHALRPDLTIVLDVPPEIAAVRREGRGEAAQLYDHSELQRELAQFYKKLNHHMPADRIVVLNGLGSLEEVHGRILGAYDRAFS